MSDSNAPDALAEKRSQRRAQRVEQVKRWVEYIESTPPEVWGEQLNTLVDAQLEAAQNAEVSPQTYERIERASQERKSDQASATEAQHPPKHNQEDR